jgi:hypothetical protein
LLVFELAGCSTLFGRQHGEEDVFFDSNVSDVEVNCSGRRTQTPGSLPLKQSKDHTCVAERQGYEKQVFHIKSGLSGSGFAHSTAINTATTGWWTFGIGTGVGWLVDLASGAMKNLEKDQLYLEMKPVKQGGGTGEKAPL